MNWFDEKEPLRVTTQRLDADYGGTMFIEILIDTGRENGVKEPAILNAIDEVVEFAKTYQGRFTIGKSLSIIDVNKEIHQALNNNDSRYYRIPDNQPLVSQELLLFENSGSDDLEKLTDGLYSKARITLKLPNLDAMHYPEFQQTFYPKVYAIFDGKADVSFTGLMDVISGTIPALISSMIRSYTLALFIITPIMMLLLGSWRAGLLSMIPNVTPIIIMLGSLKLLGIPLDAFILLMGSIALGLAVDDTIHFMHNYQRFYRRYGDSQQAILESLRTTGQALLFTTVVLVISFYIYTLSSIQNLVTFGTLTGSCIALAFLADALLAPALVTIAANRRKKIDT